jgi:hypothetical protein
MSVYTRSIIWALAMLMVALGSRMGLVDDKAGDVVLMALLAGWVASMPRSGSCRLGAFKP